MSISSSVLCNERGGGGRSEGVVQYIGGRRESEAGRKCVCVCVCVWCGVERGRDGGKEGERESVCVSLTLGSIFPFCLAIAKRASFTSFSSFTTQNKMSSHTHTHIYK